MTVELRYFSRLKRNYSKYILSTCNNKLWIRIESISNGLLRLKWYFVNKIYNFFVYFSITCLELSVRTGGSSESIKVFAKIIYSKCILFSNRKANKESTILALNGNRQSGDKRFVFSYNFWMQRLWFQEICSRIFDFHKTFNETICRKPIKWWAFNVYLLILEFFIRMHWVKISTQSLPLFVLFSWETMI